MRALVIDVGNTSTGIARWTDGAISRSAHINGGLAANPGECLAAVRAAAEGGLDAAMLATVVPRAELPWRWLVRSELGLDLARVRPSLRLDVSIDYPEPERLGDDRIADACGGVQLYGAPLIVADFGTALTFDCIMPDRRYIGGVITPGLPLMTDYLPSRTAQLPRVELTGECPPMGRSSVQAMRIGAEVGYRGMVREIAAYLRNSMRCPAARLVATGGYARWALKDSGIACDFDPDLTLFGIGRILSLNSPAPHS